MANDNLKEVFPTAGCFLVGFDLGTSDDDISVLTVGSRNLSNHETTIHNVVTGDEVLSLLKKLCPLSPLPEKEKKSNGCTK